MTCSSTQVVHLKETAGVNAICLLLALRRKKGPKKVNNEW